MATVSRYETSGGEPRWAVRYRDGAGRQRWLTVAGPKRNAERLRREIEHRQALGDLYEEKPDTLGGFLGLPDGWCTERWDDPAGWLGRHRQRVRPSTWTRRVEALRALLVASPELAARRLDRLTAAELEDAVAALAARAPRQAQLGLATLRQALRNARDRRQPVSEALLAVTAPRYDEREPRFLSWAEVETLASWMPEHSKRLVLVAALTGARQGELLALRDVDVDLERQTMTIVASAGDGTRARTKTRASRRTVDLGGHAATLVREQLVARPPTPTGLMFPAPRGDSWRRDNYMARVFRPAARRARLDGLTFHDLRHTHVSLMIAAHVDPVTIARQLGHRNARLIWERYAHLYDGAGRQAADALDRHIRDATQKAAEA